MHCHSMVNARDCTLRPEWQCPLHCHSTSSVPRRCAQARVAVPTMRDCTLRAEWQCPLHCHSTSSVPRRRARARVAVPTTRGCTLRPEWQCGFGWPTSQQSLRRCQGAPPGRVSGERVLSLVRDGPFAGSGTSSCKAGRDGCAAGQPDVVSLPQGGTAAPHCTTPPC